MIDFTNIKPLEVKGYEMTGKEGCEYAKSLYKPKCKHNECFQAWYRFYVTEMGFELE